MPSNPFFGRGRQAGNIAALLLALFCLPFLFGGIYFGIAPLYGTLTSAWQVRTWESAPVQVLSSDLSTRHDSDSGTLYRVQARYRYQVQGIYYESSRVGLSDTGQYDNIDDWHLQWHRRLQAAQQDGTPLIARVNPMQPSQAVLDDHIRWAGLLFRLPFAIVFTLVGLGGLIGIFRHLSKRPEDVTSPQHSASKGAWTLSFGAVFWCGLAFPMTALFWMNTSPWYVKAFLVGFSIIGVGLIIAAVRQARVSQRYKDSHLTFAPAAPSGGERLDVKLLVHQDRWHGVTSVKLRLAQYRVDDAGSSSSERQVQAFDQTVRPTQRGDGLLQLSARFEVPDDAPTNGSRRMGDRVDWRLEVLTASGKVETSFDVPIRESESGAKAAALRDTKDAEQLRDRWKREEPVNIDSLDDPHPVPPPLQLTETPEQWSVVSRAGIGRWLAVPILLFVAYHGYVWWRDLLLPLDGATWSWVLNQRRLWVVAAALAALVHVLTSRRGIIVHDNGMVAQRESWMWRTHLNLPVTVFDHLFIKLVFMTSSGKAGSGRDSQSYYALYARATPDAKPIRLTTALPGMETAMAAGKSVLAAWQHRAGRFTPGAANTRWKSFSRPHKGWLLWAVLMAALLSARGVLPGF